MARGTSPHFHVGSGSGSRWLATRKVFWKAIPRDARVRIRDTRVNFKKVLKWSGKASRRELGFFAKLMTKLQNQG